MRCCGGPKEPKREKKEINGENLKMSNSMAPAIIFFVISLVCNSTMGYNILLATMGGTKSHTVPFVALGSSLKARGHNVTLLSAFPGPAANSGLQEFVPPIFEVDIFNLYE